LAETDQNCQKDGKNFLENEKKVKMFLPSRSKNYRAEIFSKIDFLITGIKFAFSVDAK